MDKITRRDFWGITALGLGELALGPAWTTQGPATQASASVVPAANPQSVQQAFKNPPNRYKPMVRRWWPGNDVEDAELQREIRELSAAGFGGAEIQSFSCNLRPEMPVEARHRVYGFGTSDFFAHVRAAVDEARAHGMWIDLTFGSGWPFGGGSAVTPERAITELYFSDTHIKGGERYHASLELPTLGARLGVSKALAAFFGSPPFPAGWDARMNTRARTVAVIGAQTTAPEGHPAGSNWAGGSSVLSVVEKSGQLDPHSIVNLTSQVSPDGVLDWDVPAGDWRLFIFRQLNMDSAVIGEAWPGPGLILDHFQRPAFDAYSAQIGDALRAELSDRLGNGLRALFCDSLEIPANIYWSDDFLQEFRKRRGYDLAPYLPLIKQTGYNDPYNPLTTKPLYDVPETGDAIRRDYWRTVSELIIERLYKPFADWAAKHRLMARIQAHGAPADLLRIYGLASIPETEQLYAGGLYDFLKMASSAADIYGKKIVSSESFVFQGDAYRTTPEQLKVNTDKLITAGVNEIIYHGYPYVYNDRPYPGWSPFAMGTQLSFSSVLNGRSTFWPYIGQINTYITRLQYISQTGTNVAPVAVFFSRTGYDTSRSKNPPLIDALMNAGYAFDHLNAEGLLEGRVEGRQIVTQGGIRFSAIILSETAWLDRQVAETFAQIARAGVPVIAIGDPPSQGGSWKNFEADGRAVRTAMNQMLAEPNSRKVASTDAAVAALAPLAAPNLKFVSGKPLPFIEKRLGKLDALFITNPDPQPVSTEIETMAAGSPQLWNPWTGNIKPFTDFDIVRGSKRLRLELPAYGSVLLMFDPSDRHGPRPRTAPSSPATPVRLSVGTSGWKLHAVGYDINGKPVTFDETLPQLTDWSKHTLLKTFAGRGTYTTVIKIPEGDLHAGGPVRLDLGDVKDVAEIKVNGQAGPTLLMQPYVANITDLVHAGRNTLEITVVNAPSNAASPRPPVISSGGPQNPFLQPAPFTPKPAGLIGPVTLKIGG